MALFHVFALAVHPTQLSFTGVPEAEPFQDGFPDHSHGPGNLIFSPCLFSGVFVILEDSPGSPKNSSLPHSLRSFCHGLRPWSLRIQEVVSEPIPLFWGLCMELREADYFHFLFHGERDCKNHFHEFL